MKHISLLSLLVISIFLGCSTKSEIEFYPSDHMFHQRSYPYGTVDLVAVDVALKWRSEILEYYKNANSAEWFSSWTV